MTRLNVNTIPHPPQLSIEWMESRLHKMLFQSNKKFEFISVVLAILTAVLVLIHPGNAPAAIELDSIS